MPRGEKSTTEGAAGIVEVSKQYGQHVAALKAYTEERKARRKYTQEGVTVAYNAIRAYAEDCKHKKEPLTVAGMMLAVGMQRDAWYRAKDGDLDYLLEEYLLDNNINDNDIVYDDQGLPWYFKDDETAILLLPWSEIRKNSDLLIQDQLERNCYTNRGNPAGSIFGLKAQFAWREDETPQHLVQQLVIADLDQAKKALEMLK